MRTPLPSVEPMTGGEFRSIRQRLGLSQARLARVLDKAQQTIHRWETSDEEVDPTAALAIRKLEEDAQAAGKIPGDGAVFLGKKVKAVND